MKDRLYISQDKEEAFKSVSSCAPLKELNLSAKKVFLLAASFGAKNRIKEKLRVKKEYVRMEYLDADDKCILKAIAVQDKGNLDVLIDSEEVYNISEEYASGGIDFLKSLIFSHEDASVAKRFEKLLLEERE